MVYRHINGSSWILPLLPASTQSENGNLVSIFLWTGGPEQANWIGHFLPVGQCPSDGFTAANPTLRSIYFLVILTTPAIPTVFYRDQGLNDQGSQIHLSLQVSDTKSSAVKGDTSGILWVWDQTLRTGLVSRSRDDQLGCNHLHGKPEAFSRAIKHQHKKTHY